MPEGHIIFGFTAGEVAPEFYNRTDLTKFELGVGIAQNFFIDYRGGAVSRPGSKFINHLLSDSSEVKLVRFRGTGDDYVLVFTNLAMRVVRSGGYLLEADVPITGISQADPGVVTSVAHGYTTGDWVYITGVVGMTEVNKRYFSINVLTVDTYELLDHDGGNIDTTGYTAYVSGGVSAKVFTLVTPYLSADITTLKAEQRFAGTTLTHNNYTRRRLTYISDTNWTLTEITSGAGTAAPTVPTAITSAVGAAGAVFAVTAVGQDGSESLPSPYAFLTASINWSVTAGSVSLTWPAVVGARFYYVYRSLIMPNDVDISQAMEVGFIGRAIGPQFTDSNITPDFTKLPPSGYDPFANETVQYIEITTGGTGYSNADTVSLSLGTGFVGYPVVDTAGTIVGVSIINGGTGYAGAVVTFSGGTGATATVTASAATGNNPKVFKVFQQRGVYAGTENFPMTVDGSKPGDLDNFDSATVVSAGDAYSFTLDQQSVRPIKHLVSLRSGLLCFTDANIEQIRAEEGKAVTPINALSETQGYKGASDVTPLTVDLDILFTQQTLGSLFAMSYTTYTNSYTLQDLSILSSHLFGKDLQISNMTYAAEPNKLIYCTRTDGTRLLFTYLREQEVFAWARDQTKGMYGDNLAIIEGDESVVYQTVERTLATGTHKYLERVARREFKNVEDTWGVDCGLSYPTTFPAATCTPAAATGTDISFAFSADISSDIAVGDIIYVGGGKAEVTAVPSGIELTCTLLRDITAVQKEDSTNTPLPQLANSWDAATPTMSVTGLDHLEGESVSVLADGDALLNKLVTNGTITLEIPATRIIVGLPYKCRLRTLAVTTAEVLVEGKYKSVAGVAIRVLETRGLTVGKSFEATDLFPMKDRTDEDWGEALNLRSDMPMRYVSKGWDKDGYLYFEQAYPLPASILGYVASVELGDL